MRRTLSALHTETRGQIGRLELLFETIGRRPRARHNAATLGLVVDGEDLIRRIEPGPVRDAAMEAAAHVAVEHVRARYTALAAWAEQVGEHEAARLLRRTLDEKRFGRTANQSGTPAKAA